MKRGWNPVEVGDIYEWWDDEDGFFRYYLILEREGERVATMELTDGSIVSDDYVETFADPACVRLVEVV